ncbi:MAG: tetratricopeptide repeat protein [Spirochaetales bacterium]|nr:tetratricopeptide repeat protein [Spirochaetales bacterium]
MKRLLITLLVLLITFYSFGQAVHFSQALTEYYKVYTDVSDAYAVEIAEKMEAALVLFNNIFHFDLSTLETKFKVTIYKDKSGFDKYLSRLLGQARDDFVYIHYTDLRKSELVGFVKADEKEMTSSLLHQGLIQFVKSFIPNIPIWISEGTAAYIENSTYTTESPSVKTGEEEFSEEEYSEEEESDSGTEESASGTEESASGTTTGHFILNKSLIWLDSLKALLKGETGNSVIPVSELLTIDKDSAVALIDIFYPQAWGLVYFLLNTPDKAYNRLFWDTLNILDPSKSLKENSETVRDMVFKWKNLDTLYNDFKKYILALKTFNDYLKEGLDFYNNNELTKAEASFKTAIDIKPGHYFAYYYLGLIAYTNKDYYAAEEYYLKALGYGADMALTYYALGVNAYAENNFDNAIAYLNGSVQANPDKYQDKVDFLLERIKSEKMDEDMYLDYEPDTDRDIDEDLDMEMEESDESGEDDEYDESDEFDESGK